jgi:hypothetical protein
MAIKKEDLQMFYTTIEEYAKRCFYFPIQIGRHFIGDQQAGTVGERNRTPADELVENVMAGYFDELVETREMLGSRYDDIKSGKVKLIPGDEVIARLRERSAAFRLRHA